MEGWGWHLCAVWSGAAVEELRDDTDAQDLAHVSLTLRLKLPEPCS